GLDRILQRAVALAAAGAHARRTHRAQEHACARDALEFGQHPVDHVFRTDIAPFRGRFQGDEELAGVGGAAAPPTTTTTDGAGHLRHGRIGPDDVAELNELLLHRLIGDALVAADIAEDAALVDFRKEALGNDA